MTRPEGMFMCCGTTCNAQANLEYTLELEAENKRLTDENRKLNNALYTMSERINNGLIKGDTTGTTR